MVVGGLMFFSPTSVPSIEYPSDVRTKGFLEEDIPLGKRSSNEVTLRKTPPFGRPSSSDFTKSFVFKAVLLQFYTLISRTLVRRFKLFVPEISSCLFRESSNKGCKGFV